VLARGTALGGLASHLAGDRFAGGRAGHGDLVWYLFCYILFLKI
jgi:hypothetical protein